MSSSTTQTTIANRALQLLGSMPISSLQENSGGARAMNRAYIPVKEKELRNNFWGFSIRRQILPASTVVPEFGPTQYFPLPPDFLEMAPPDTVSSYTYGLSNAVPTNTVYSDLKIEQMPNNGGLAIVTSQSGPIYLRYVSNAVTESSFDSSFCEAFAVSLAIACCEQITQSNTKLQNLMAMYKDVMGMAKKRNAYESQPVKPPVDSWLIVRS